MSRKSITFTEKQAEWLKLVVTQGHYKDVSDYVRDLVRKDEEKNRKFLAIKAAIHKGIESGISENSLDDIWKKAEEKFKANT